MTNKIHFKEPEFTVTGNADRSIVCIYPNADRGASDVVLNFDAKYLKFVYSNAFGFSLPRAYDDIKRFGGDNSLVFSYDDIHFMSRGSIIDYKNTLSYLYSKYQIGGDICVESYIVPICTKHYRVHCISTKSKIYVYDADYAIKELSLMTKKLDNKLEIINDEYTSIITNYDNAGDLRPISQCSNTNIIYPHTCYPTAKYNLSRGKYFLINCFDAKKNGDADVDINVKIKNNKVIIGDICIPIYKHKLPTRNYYKHIIVNILRKIKKQIK